MKIFFSTPLTNLADPERSKQFFNKLDALAKDMGFGTFWAFLSGTDPILNPEVKPREVYRRDIKALDESDLMIAYVGEPSTGVGIEIEHANKTGKSVVILYEEGKRVSRMLRGCPAVKEEIVFTSEEDAISKLRSYLSGLTSQR